jgi:hypothetical protein
LDSVEPPKLQRQGSIPCRRAIIKTELEFV